jgi:tetratricopeptide (TPR) repeat protein
MSIRGKSRTATPGQELKNFTDRENELAFFHRLLDRDEPAKLPVVMFFGVGGTGKTWLLKRMRDSLAESWSIPCAYVDFDRRSGGPSYVNDFSELLAEVWRQLNVACPRFETAYAWMRFKQGALDRPLIRGAGKISSAWELVKEVAGAGLQSVSAMSLIAWFTHKSGEFAARKLAETPLGMYLLSKVGWEDYVYLSRLTAQEIYLTLSQRLGEDLEGHLPARTGKSCRGVLFLDTFEDLAVGEQNDARRQILEEPVRRLYEDLPSVLLVVFGRDRLTWDEIDPEWGTEENLVHILLGGLTRHDAALFLTRCGITPGPLHEALLSVSIDPTAREGKVYYPFVLGLCAETVVAERSRGLEPSPDTFDMEPGDYAKLAQRFMKSLHDEHPEGWIVRLAQTPRFDETAARAAFSAKQDVHQDKAWESLPDYSFVEQDAKPGWVRIQSVMSNVLNRRLAGEEERFAVVHAEWSDHWRARSKHETDEFAGLAWYHEYVLDPRRAVDVWLKRAREAREARAMGAHLALIGWWDPVDLERRGPRSRVEAIALNELATELGCATLGNRAANLRRAIAAVEAALKVCTVAEFPAGWAGMQNNLGNAYSNLPTGDRGANLRRSIECYEAALCVYAKVDLPVDRAMTQNNLGGSYSQLPTGDRGENLQRAIEYYRAALQVYTEADFPADWAMIQNNLGGVYSELPTGNRGENLGRAIDCFNAALRVCTEADSPADWAWTQSNLGTAYCRLPTGDRGDNLRRAIERCEAALRVRTESNFPVDWAGTLNNLGNAYANLTTGDRGENLRRAIDCFKLVLRVYTESDFPTEWAMTQTSLGNAYAKLPTGDRGENLRLAIACYDASQRVRTESNFPVEWAGVQNNLGNAYVDLPTGDRGENCRRAVAYFEAALRVCTVSDFPVEWAGVQNNLGTAYSGLPAADRSGNLRCAIGCFEEALRVRTETDFPRDWAATQYNLGLALRGLARFLESVVAFELAARGYGRVGEVISAAVAQREADVSRRLAGS